VNEQEATDERPDPRHILVALLPGTPVIHALGVVSRVKKVHPPGTYMAPEHDDPTPPLDEHVVEFEDGNAFLLHPDAFTVIPELQMKVYEHCSARLRRAAMQCFDDVGKDYPEAPVEATRQLVEFALGDVVRKIKAENWFDKLIGR
jgi:hypothetical protein